MLTVPPNSFIKKVGSAIAKLHKISEFSIFSIYEIIFFTHSDFSQINNIPYVKRWQYLNNLPSLKKLSTQRDDIFYI